MPWSLTQLVPLLSLCRWIPQCRRRPLHLSISSLQLAVLISPLRANRSWSAHAQSPSTRPTWPLPQSRSVWAPVSRAPASIWRALYGRKQRTVSSSCFVHFFSFFPWPTYIQYIGSVQRLGGGGPTGCCSYLILVADMLKNTIQTCIT